MIPIKVTREDNFDEWNKLRQQSIGASEVAALLGKDKFTTKQELWNQKKFGYEFKSNVFSEMGQAIEDSIINIVWNKYQRPELIATPNKTTFYNPDSPNIITTPDAFILDNIPLQIKTTINYSAWKQGVPEHVRIQNQIEMLVCGVDHGYICGIVGGNWGKPVIERQELDNEFISFVVPEINEFLNSLVLDANPYNS